MSGLYDTLAVNIISKDLTNNEKNELSKWISSLENKEIIKKIFILISEHAKRAGEDYINPYNVKVKNFQGNFSTMFALNELPIELRVILWKFYKFQT